MTATGKSLLAQRTIKKVRVLQETLYRAAKENLRRAIQNNTNETTLSEAHG